jgi:hypothetical protein
MTSSTPTPCSPPSTFAAPPDHSSARYSALRCNALSWRLRLSPLAKGASTERFFNEKTAVLISDVRRCSVPPHLRRRSLQDSCSQAEPGNESLALPSWLAMAARSPKSTLSHRSVQRLIPAVLAHFVPPAQKNATFQACKQSFHLAELLQNSLSQTQLSVLLRSVAANTP